MWAFAVEAVNSFALVGLEQLEKFFPILQQPTDEVSVWESKKEECIFCVALSISWKFGKSRPIYFKYQN